MSGLIYNELLNDEKVIWEGQSNGKLFTSGDLLLIPFSIMWAGFAVFWELSVMTMGAPPFFRIWGIPFVAIGLYITIGRFFYKNFRAKNTYYYVTNKRVIIIKDLVKTKTTALYIDKLDIVKKKVGRNGDGTIRFGSSSGMLEIYANSGMEFFLRGYRYRNKNIPPAFYNIEDVEEVYKLICNNKIKTEL